MDTSSESDTYERPRGREAHRRAAWDRSAGNGIAGDGQAAGISEKISTLASTLQDTNRNLTKVDRMLGKYREHTDDQAEAMALLRDNLEESISQLQAQRLSRSTKARSASASASGSLHSNDLEACSGSDGQRFYPTSPLRDYAGAPGRRRRRRSQSATVCFRDTDLSREETHILHQSLRDLHSDQQRLSDDLDREILRRNRSEIDTRRAMENLTGHLTSSQRQDVASRVERRLQELEREMHAERQSEGRRGRPDHGVAVSDDMQETFGRQEAHAQERREASEKSETERSKVKQELERALRLLKQSEDRRGSLLQQVEYMHGELLQTRMEKMELQRARLETAQPNGHHSDGEERRGGERGSDRSDLEREVAELRAQLSKALMHNEVEELKKILDRKERERVQLSIQVEELSSDLVRREQQQLQMLEQLKEIQSCSRSQGHTERPEMEALLQETLRSRDELKTRAQEAVRQWRAKCKRLQKKLEEAMAQAQRHTDMATQATKEKESSQAQMKALSQQSEAVHRELTDTLGRMAQREEELHRKEVEVHETRQRQLSLEQELREVQEASAALEEEVQHKAVLQARLKEENQRLEERVDTQDRRSQREQAAQAELQAALKELTSTRAQLSQRLAEEESSRKELQKMTAESQAKLAAAKEERASLLRQLQLEREVHQKELDNVKAMAEGGRSKKGRELQDMLQLCQEERDEMRAHIVEVKAEAESDKRLCGVLRIKLDRMKDECDKLVEQLSAKEEAHALLHRKYQLLKQEVDDNARFEEQARGSEAELEEKLLRVKAEQEVLLTSVGEELDVACRSLAVDCADKLQVISQKPGLVKDPHCWLAETKGKLRWLCEEVRECHSRERRHRKQHQQARDQLKALRQRRDSEQAALLQRLDRQEKLLHALGAEKKELLERNCRKEEEMRSIQDHVLDLEMSTRAALDHLEATPEKSSLMEDFRDLEESQRQREAAQQCYAKCKEIVWDLQHQLDQSKFKMQEYQEEKLDAVSRSVKLASLSPSIKGSSTFGSSLRSDAVSTRTRLASSDFGDAMVNGSRSLTD